MQRHGGPAKRGRRRGTMCPSPHRGETDPGCTLPPFPDLAPVRKCLGTFSAQFRDFRPVQAQIAATRRRTLCIMVRIVRQRKEIARCWQLREKLKCARSADATTFLATAKAHMTSEQVALVQSSFKSV